MCRHATTPSAGRVWPLSISNVDRGYGMADSGVKVQGTGTASVDATGTTVSQIAIRVDSHDELFLEVLTISQ
jgi:hypothetical protein